MNISKTFIPIILVSLTSCFNKAQKDIASVEGVNIAAKSEITTKNPMVLNNGKRKDAVELNQLYTTQNLDPTKLPEIDDRLREGLLNQLTLLKNYRQKNIQTAGNLSVSVNQMEAVVKTLLDKNINAGQTLDMHQIQGKDKKGSVYFTGYYTPVIRANKTKTAKYNHPIYRFPKNWEGSIPERHDIDEGNVLEGLGYEVAYAKYPEDVYYMQLQGSGFVKYPSGETEYLGFDGTNRKRYRSIERYLIKNKMLPKGASVTVAGIKKYFKENPEMRSEVLSQNPSYTFFDTNGSQPIGAGTVPLTAGHSIAVDKSKIPLGSVLLASVPVYYQGKIVDHEYKILLAQDVGGAIKGAGHIDFYQGVGDQGQLQASKYHHYGQIWILTPKAQV